GMISQHQPHAPHGFRRLYCSPSRTTSSAMSHPLSASNQARNVVRVCSEAQARPDVGSYLAVSVEPKASKGPRGLERLLELQELDSALDRLQGRKELLESAGELRDARGAAQVAEDRLAELQLQ